MGRVQLGVPANFQISADRSATTVAFVGVLFPRRLRKVYLEAVGKREKPRADVRHLVSDSFGVFQSVLFTYLAGFFGNVRRRLDQHNSCVLLIVKRPMERLVVREIFWLTIALKPGSADNPFSLFAGDIRMFQSADAVLFFNAIRANSRIFEPERFLEINSQPVCQGIPPHEYVGDLLGEELNFVFSRDLHQF